jgi:hypothetical protein
MEEGVRDKKWQWIKTWKLSCPLKTRIFSWLGISNKILYWDNGQKGNWHGLAWCIMCKRDTKTMNHLFVQCSYKIFME